MGKEWVRGKRRRKVLGGVKTYLNVSIELLYKALLGGERLQVMTSPMPVLRFVPAVLAVPRVSSPLALSFLLPSDPLVVFAVVVAIPPLFSIIWPSSYVGKRDFIHTFIKLS